MNIKSLGYSTDFIFNEFDGAVTDKGDYTVIKTHSNPNYFWGNLLLFPAPPYEGDFPIWKSLFEKEFKGIPVHHMTFGWDSPNGDLGDIRQFTDKGFSLEESVVLATEIVRPAPKLNGEITVREIEDGEFEQVLDVQLACAGDHLSESTWREFYKKSIAHYRAMIAAGRGKWFGAFMGKRLVGSLGIFTKENLGRYQMVSVHPDFQRRGICGTMVFESANFALNKMGVEKLVMVADEHYHAAKIYESVGFKPVEKMVGVCWWDKSVHK